MKTVIKFYAVSFLVLFMSLSAFAQKYGSPDAALGWADGSPPEVQAAITMVGNFSGFEATFLVTTDRQVHSIRMPNGEICMYTNTCIGFKTFEYTNPVDLICEVAECYVKDYPESSERRDGCTVIIGPNAIEDIISGYHCITD